ncbi:hypothetical protein Nizo2855_2106 [Lactiplantibacillus plantarum]|nr:hypothetical protein Nizo2855_2106 [Lactiplantibacillus plantarum]
MLNCASSLTDYDRKKWLVKKFSQKNKARLEPSLPGFGY